MGKGEKHRTKSLPEEWTERTEGFTGGFSALPQQSPILWLLCPGWAAVNGILVNWMGQSSAEPLQLPQSCRHSPRVKDLGFLFLSLAQGCESPSRLSTIQLFIQFHFLERKSKRKKRVHRKLLCSRDTQSWLEGWGWEAKWKSFPDKSLCWLVLWHSASQMKNQKKKNQTKITNQNKKSNSSFQ